MLPKSHYSHRLSVERPCADLTIVCSDGSVAAHRAVLACHSPLLREVFLQLDNSDQQGEYLVLAPDLELAMLENLLKVLYGAVKEMTVPKTVLSALGITLTSSSPVIPPRRQEHRSGEEPICNLAPSGRSRRSSGNLKRHIEDRDGAFWCRLCCSFTSCYRILMEAHVRKCLSQGQKPREVSKEQKNTKLCPSPTNVFDEEPEILGIFPPPNPDAVRKQVSKEQKNAKLCKSTNVFDEEPEILEIFAPQNPDAVKKQVACRRCGQLFDNVSAMRMHEAGCSRVAYQCGLCALILPDMEAIASHSETCHPTAQQIPSEEGLAPQPSDQFSQQTEIVAVTLEQQQQELLLQPSGDSVLEKAVMEAELVLEPVSGGLTDEEDHFVDSCVGPDLSGKNSRGHSDASVLASYQDTAEQLSSSSLVHSQAVSNDAVIDWDEEDAVAEVVEEEVIENDNSVVLLDDYSEAGTRAPDVDFETTEVLVQCEEEEEGEDDEDLDQGAEDGEDFSFLCPVCRNGFAQSEQLSAHILDHPTCVVCTTLHFNKEALSQHTEENHRYCSTCALWLLDAAAWDSHQQSFHTSLEEQLPTPVTYQSIEIRDAVNSIQPEASKQEPVKLHCCPLCQRSFSSRDVLQLHLSSSHGKSLTSPTQPFSKVDFISPTKMKVEVMVSSTCEDPASSDQLAFACTLCDASCPTSAELDLHTLTEHAALLDLVDEETNEGAPVVVEQDPDVANEGAEMVANQEAEPTYLCSLCSTSFDAIRALSHHISTAHPLEMSEIKPVACAYCESTFLVPTTLEKHYAAKHPGSVGVYQCGICERQLKKAAGLLKHMRVHSAQRALFKCGRCGQVFRCEAGIAKHGSRCAGLFRADRETPDLRIALGPEAKGLVLCCARCGDELTDSGLNHTCLSSSARKKKKRGENAPRFQCADCHKTFPSERRLSKHFRRRHQLTGQAAEGEEEGRRGVTTRRFKPKKTTDGDFVELASEDDLDWDLEASEDEYKESGEDAGEDSSDEEQEENSSSSSDDEIDLEDSQGFVEALIVRKSGIHAQQSRRPSPLKKTKTKRMLQQGQTRAEQEAVGSVLSVHGQGDADETQLPPPCKGRSIVEDGRVRPFACSFCDKRFLNRGHLKDHIILHTGVYPFNCHCGAGFRRTKKLDEHKERCRAMKPPKRKGKAVCTNSLSPQATPTPPRRRRRSTKQVADAAASDPVEAANFVSEEDLTSGGLFNCEACSFATNNGAMFTAHLQSESHLGRLGLAPAGVDPAESVPQKEAPEGASSDSEGKKIKKRYYHYCPYCPFKVDRRSLMEKHRRHKHPAPRRKGASAEVPVIASASSESLQQQEPVASSNRKTKVMVRKDENAIKDGDKAAAKYTASGEEKPAVTKKNSALAGKRAGRDQAMKISATPELQTIADVGMAAAAVASDSDMLVRSEVSSNAATPRKLAVEDSEVTQSATAKEDRVGNWLSEEKISRSGRKIKRKRRFSEEVESRDEDVKRPRLTKDTGSPNLKPGHHHGASTQDSQNLKPGHHHGASTQDSQSNLKSCVVRLERLHASILECYKRQQAAAAAADKKY